MKWMHVVSFLLVIIGALNWGLIGLFGFNLVSALLSWSMLLERLVYVLVGVGAVYLLIKHKDECMVCGMKMKKGKK